MSNDRDLHLERLWRIIAYRRHIEGQEQLESSTRLFGRSIRIGYSRMLPEITSLVECESINTVRALLISEDQSLAEYG